MKAIFYCIALSLAVVTTHSAVWAEEHADSERAELAKALSGAKVPLKAGLGASASEGKPISGKYEVEDGKLQLSVYTEKNGKFSEVVVDPKSGKIVKREAITEGEDLTAAKAQSGAMAKAKKSLMQAVADAIARHHGYRAVSAMPTLKNGEPVAEIELVKGNDWKTETAKLS